MEPIYDMDGSHFHQEPTEEDVAAYYEAQRQEDEWIEAGLCGWCGGPLSGNREGKPPFCDACITSEQAQENEKDAADAGPYGRIS